MPLDKKIMFIYYLWLASAEATFPECPKMLAHVACVPSNSSYQPVRINNNFFCVEFCIEFDFFLTISFEFIRLLFWSCMEQSYFFINKSMLYGLLATGIDIVSLQSKPYINDTNEVFSFPFASFLNGTRKTKFEMFLCVCSNDGSHRCRHRHCRYSWWMENWARSRRAMEKKEAKGKRQTV